MPDRIDQRTQIATALAGFENQSLADSAKRLFGTLGYKSDRALPITTPKQFCAQLDPGGKLTAQERASLEKLQSLTLLFQLTDAELTPQQDLFDDGTSVETTEIRSYLFFAAELPPGHYTRTVLSRLVRAVNKPLPMPGLILFRHGHHPLRIALDKLQTLDTIRIIEGKT